MSTLKSTIISFCMGAITSRMILGSVFEWEFSRNIDMIYAIMMFVMSILWITTRWVEVE